MAKAFGEASMTDNGLDAGAQARQFAFGQLRDVVSDEVNQQVESWLSPWGRATIDVKVDDTGALTVATATGLSVAGYVPLSQLEPAWPDPAG
jgi:hypothetical protein